MAACRRASGIVLHEAVEVHLLSVPSLGQVDGHAPLAAERAGRQQALPERRAPRHEVHTVVAQRQPVLGIALERHLHPAPLLPHSSEAHRCHGALAHHQVLVVDRQHRLAVKGETAVVEADEVVALGAVALHRLVAQADAEHTQEVGCQLCRLAEERAPLLLLLGARIMYTTRTRPQAPNAAPLVPDDGAHRPAVAVVDSVCLSCHLLIILNLIYLFYMSANYTNLIFVGEFCKFYPPRPLSGPPLPGGDGCRRWLIMTN